MNEPVKYRCEMDVKQRAAYVTDHGMESYLSLPYYRPFSDAARAQMHKEDMTLQDIASFKEKFGEIEFSKLPD